MSWGKKVERKIAELEKKNVLLILVLVFVFFFFLDMGLRSHKGDIHYVQMYGDLFYNSVFAYGEFPAYSFFFNTGAHFISDPQSPFFSSWPIWTLLFGPHQGFRVEAAILALIGVLGFFLWIRTYVGRYAALFGALGWICSSGFFWRAIANHFGMFWYALLPWFLIAVDRCLDAKKQVPFRAVGFGGILGGFALWAYSYHAIIELFLPALIIYILVRLVVKFRSGRFQSVSLVYLLSVPLIGLAIAFPRIASFFSSTMSRPAGQDGTIHLKDSLYYLFQTARTGEMGVKIMGLPGPTEYFWYIWEVAQAPMLVVTLFFVVGLASGWKENRQVMIYGALSLLFGIIISSQLGLWNWLKAEVIGDSLRVPARFLAVSCFGIVVIASMGAQKIFTQWKRRGASIFAASLVVLVGLAVDWRNRAIGEGSLLEVRRPLFSHRMAEAVRGNPQLSMQQSNIADGKIIVFSNQILQGTGYQGSDVERFLRQFFWVRDDWDKEKLVPLAAGIRPNQIQVSNSKIELLNFGPGQKTRLLIRRPPQGFSVWSTDPATLRWDIGFYSFQLKNRSDRVIERIVIEPDYPVPLWGFILALGSLGIAIGLAQRKA